MIAFALRRAGYVGLWLPVLAVGGLVFMQATPPSLFWTPLTAVVMLGPWAYVGIRVLRTPDRAWDEGRLEGASSPVEGREARPVEA